jgi:hypothetical protein
MDLTAQHVRNREGQEDDLHRHDIPRSGPFPDDWRSVPQSRSQSQAPQTMTPAIFAGTLRETIAWWLELLAVATWTIDFLRVRFRSLRVNHPKR